MYDNISFTPAEIERYCAARIPGLKEIGVNGHVKTSKFERPADTTAAHVGVA